MDHLHPVAVSPLKSIESQTNKYEGYTVELEPIEDKFTAVNFRGCIKYKGTVLKVFSDIDKTMLVKLIYICINRHLNEHKYTVDFFTTG